METSARKGLVVLIVEDFADAREMYEDYLAFAGMTVLTACNGEEAVRMATEHRPDVIVMDAGLPRLTGWEATAMLKNNPDTADLKILMLTGHVFRESEASAREAGVDVFVGKPCLPDVLHRHILALAGQTTPEKPPKPSSKKERACAAATDTASRIGAAATAVLHRIPVSVTQTTRHARATVARERG